MSTGVLQRNYNEHRDSAIGLKGWHDGESRTSGERGLMLYTGLDRTKSRQRRGQGGGLGELPKIAVYALDKRERVAGVGFMQGRREQLNSRIELFHWLS